MQRSFVVLCVTEKEGFSTESASAIRNIITDESPIDFIFLNPGTYYVYFSADVSGNKRAVILAKNLRNFAVQHKISQFGVGIKSGLLHVQLGGDGRFISHPVGEANSLAHNAAILEAENVL